MIYSKMAFFVILHMQILCSMEPIGTRAYAFAGKERSLNAARSMCEGEWGRARGKQKKNAGRHTLSRRCTAPASAAPKAKVLRSLTVTALEARASWAHPNVGALWSERSGFGTAGG